MLTATPIVINSGNEYKIREFSDYIWVMKRITGTDEEVKIENLFKPSEYATQLFREDLCIAPKKRNIQFITCERWEERQKYLDVLEVVKGSMTRLLYEQDDEYLLYGVFEKFKEDIERCGYHVGDAPSFTNTKYEKLREFLCDNPNKSYIVYSRSSSGGEKYEKKLLGSPFLHDDFVTFVNDNIIQDDSRELDEPQFIDDKIIYGLYKKALSSNNLALKGVLNIAGDIRSLIYYRVSGQFPSDNYCLDDDSIDNWILGLTSEEQSETEKMAISLLARYELHPGACETGKIRTNSSSFYTYLFSSSTDSGKEVTGYIPPFARATNEQFNNTSYEDLRKQLLGRLVSRKKVELNTNFKGNVPTLGNLGECDIPFFCSYHSFAGPWVYLYDFSDKNALPIDSLNLLIEILISSSDIWKHIKSYRNIKSYSNILLLCSNTFPTWGTILSQNVYDGKTFRATGKWYTARFIDISLLQSLTAKNWTDYKTYANFYLKCEYLKREYLKRNNYHLEISIKGLSGTEISVGYDELKDMFEFFYKNEGLTNANWWNKMSLNLANPEENINSIIDTCPSDVHKFLLSVAGIDMKVMQINSVRGSSQEIMFCYDSTVYIKTNGDYKQIADIIGLAKGKLLIIHSASQNCDYSKAVTSVLRKLGNNDVLEKFKAFIPTGTKDSLSREEYSKIRDSDIGVCNPYSQQYNCPIPNGGFSVAQILKLIMARGNNNNCCCCCGKSVDEENARLIITYSGKQLIYEAGCSNCVDMLKKSLSRTDVDEKSQTIDYVCVAGNQHQEKENHMKHTVNDGVWRLNF